MLDLDLIRIDGGTQSRAKLNNDVVAEYVESYKADAKFPAVTVFYDGKDRWLADGFHRYHAAKQAGKKTILENIIPGTLRDAKFHSWKANQEHGQRRTNEDKRSIVLEVFADDEAGKWSDNHIAKEFGFSPTFVGTVRKSLSTVDSEKPAERTYTTKHGTTATMQTGAIGKVAAPIPQLPPVVEPDADEPPDYTELDATKDALSVISEENDRLNDRLAIAAFEATEEERSAAHETLIALRADNKTLTATLRAVTLSRDSFMEENAQMKRQMAMQRKEIDKLRNNK